MDRVIGREGGMEEKGLPEKGGNARERGMPEKGGVSVKDVTEDRGKKGKARKGDSMLSAAYTMATYAWKFVINWEKIV